MKTIVLVILAISLSACSFSDRYRRDLERQGQPPQYIDGFTDGCRSGEAAAGDIYSRFVKNPNRFDSDRLYRQGWTDGFQTCKTQQMMLGR